MLAFCSRCLNSNLKDSFTLNFNKRLVRISNFQTCATFEPYAALFFCYWTLLFFIVAYWYIFWILVEVYIFWILVETLNICMT